MALSFSQCLSLGRECIVCIAGQDLSSYRGFQLGMSLDAVAQQTGIVSEARVVHQRPELIQELTWEPRAAWLTTAG